MEARLIGLDEGSAAVVRAAAGEAFGERNADLLQRVPRALLRELGDRAETTTSATWCSSRRPTGRAAMPASCARSARGLAAVRLQPSAGRPAGDLRSPRDRRAVTADRQSVEEVLLAEPRGFCAGVDRAIEIVERALAQVRRADLRAPRDRAQHLRRRTTSRPRARSSSRISPTCRRARRWCSAPTACRRRCAREADGARLQRLRRHLPAGHQGARRGRQAAPGRATSSS